MPINRRPPERAYVQLVHVDPEDNTRTILLVGWATVTDKGYITEEPLPIGIHPPEEYHWEWLPTSGLHAFRSG